MSAASGFPPKTAGSSCACPTTPCAPSTRMASKPCLPTCAPAAKRSKGANHGQQIPRQDPHDLLGRHRPLLHHAEEQEEHAGKVRIQEIRSGGAQARDVQGRQDQIIDRRCASTRRHAGAQKNPSSWRVFSRFVFHPDRARTKVFGFPKPLSFTLLLPLDTHISISLSSTDFYIPLDTCVSSAEKLERPRGR